MVPEDLILHVPAEQPDQLILLHHGVGSNAESMAGIAHYLTSAFPNSFIVSINAPFASNLAAGGWQWFSVQGVTEDNRMGRVEEAMPSFINSVRLCQRKTGVGHAATTLVGFSQGAIMSLESVKAEPDFVGRIVAFSGRFAQLPQEIPPVAFHLLHGQNDPVIPCEHSRQAHAVLAQIGGAVSLDIFPNTGHTITMEMVRCAAKRWQNKVSENRRPADT